MCTGLLPQPYFTTLMSDFLVRNESQSENFTGDLHISLAKKKKKTPQKRDIQTRDF